MGLLFQYVLAFLFANLLSATFAYNYRLRYQPEIDAIKIDAYFKNPRLYKAQQPCFKEQGRCDTIGRWLKRELWLHKIVLHIPYLCIYYLFIPYF